MEKFNWEKSIEKYDSEKAKKNKLPLYYDYYNITKDFKNVYEPAEDTFLLIDSILNDIDNGELSKQNIVSIELGIGNCLVSCCFLGKVKEKGINIEKHFCIDINKDAIELGKRLINNYNLSENVIFLESDLFESINTQNKFDVVIFNPPYVTTDEDEYKKGLINKDIYASWAGGKKGSETIFKFANQIKDFIKPDGVIYLLLSKENEYESIIEKITSLCGFDCEILMKRKAINEKLGVFKFYKK